MRTLVLALLLLATPAHARWYAIDGDTIANSETRERIRIENIDTPEIKGACVHEIDIAMRAKAYTARALTFELEIQRVGKLDRYGRTLARVRVVPFNADLGRMLIEAGLAREWTGRREGWCR